MFPFCIFQFFTYAFEDLIKTSAPSTASSFLNRKLVKLAGSDPVHWSFAFKASANKELVNPSTSLILSTVLSDVQYTEPDLRQFLKVALFKRKYNSQHDHHSTHFLKKIMLPEKKISWEHIVMIRSVRPSETNGFRMITWVSLDVLKWTFHTWKILSDCCKRLSVFTSTFSSMCGLGSICWLCPLYPCFFFNLLFFVCLFLFVFFGGRGIIITVRKKYVVTSTRVEWLYCTICIFFIFRCNVSVIIAV